MGKQTQQLPYSIRRVVQSTVLVALVMMASACGTIRHIREAQDAFNNAAEAERAAPFETDPSARWVSTAAAEYRLALGLTARELRDNRQALDEDDLLGTALMLKALCIWRLGDLGEMPLQGNELTSALDVVSAFGPEKLGTRDRTLFFALPGLRDHDLGLRAADYEGAKSFFTSAVQKIDEAITRANPPANHPIRQYLHLAQLQSLRAWLAAATAGNPAADVLQSRTAEIDPRYDATIAKLRPLWTDDGKLHQAVSQVAKRMGKNPPPE